MSSDLVLYRFFDADGGLLYIGVSVNVWHRFTEHRRKSEFFPEALWRVSC
jgi:predicted GIY-YIG superfamily endonuclease